MTKRQMMRTKGATNDVVDNIQLLAAVTKKQTKKVQGVSVNSLLQLTGVKGQSLERPKTPSRWVSRSMSVSGKEDVLSKLTTTTSNTSSPRMFERAAFPWWTGEPTGALELWTWFYWMKRIRQGTWWVLTITRSKSSRWHLCWRCHHCEGQSGPPATPTRLLRQGQANTLLWADRVLQDWGQQQEQ